MARLKYSESCDEAPRGTVEPIFEFAKLGEVRSPDFGQGSGAGQYLATHTSVIMPTRLDRLHLPAGG